MARNLLAKLIITCPDCNENVYYPNYDTHQLKHHYCAFCSKNLTTMAELRLHYYEKCPKYIIDCSNCEFIFDRRQYMKHDCMTHYKIRQLELVFIFLTCMFQAVSIGLAKQVNIAECNLVGGLRNFIIVLIPNVLFGFWLVCSLVNYSTI